MKNFRTTILTLTAIFFAVTNIFLAMGKDEHSGKNFLVSKAMADVVDTGGGGGDPGPSGTSISEGSGCESGEGCN